MTAGTPLSSHFSEEMPGRLPDLARALHFSGQKGGPEGHVKAVELVFNPSCLELIKRPWQDYYDQESAQLLTRYSAPSCFPPSTACIPGTPGVPCASARLLGLESLYVCKAPFFLTSRSPHLVHFPAFSLSDPAPCTFKSVMY